MKTIRYLLLLILLLPVLAWGHPLARPAAMAPLVVQDWNTFTNNLQRAKAIGITAITTDVWWGKVEGAGDQVFDWGYHDEVLYYQEQVAAMGGELHLLTYLWGDSRLAATYPSFSPSGLR